MQSLFPVWKAVESLMIFSLNNGSEWADNMICEENSFISDYEYIDSRLYLELYIL